MSLCAQQGQGATLACLARVSWHGHRQKRLFTACCLVLQTAKAKDPACGPKDGKSLFGGLTSGDSSWSQHRQRRLQDHGKERKELLSLTLQVRPVLGVIHVAALEGRGRGVVWGLLWV